MAISAERRQELIDKLDENIGLGILEIQHSDGKRVKYQKIDDMIKARDYHQAILKGGTRYFRKRTVRVTTDRDTGFAGQDRFYYGD